MMNLWRQCAFLISAFTAFFGMSNVSAQDATQMILARAPLVQEDQQQISEELSPNTDRVKRAILSTKIVDREPVDQLTSVSNDLRKIYFFTEIRDSAGQIVTHRWEYNRELAAEIHFSIGGNRWRFYSSKDLRPEWIGDWRISVLDETGKILVQRNFEVFPASTTGANAMESETKSEIPSADVMVEEINEDNTTVTPNSDHTELGSDIDPITGSVIQQQPQTTPMPSDTTLDVTSP